MIIILKLGKNHPDIIRVTHEKPNTIGVDDIRNQVNNDIVIKPYKGPKKIYIINEAEKMNVAAQNALLKTLEEPPEYGVILLLTTNVEAMLQTIVSRCIVLTMKPVADDVVQNYIMKEYHVPDYKAAVCAAFARGNIGKARQLASSEDFDNIKDMCRAITPVPGGVGPMTVASVYLNLLEAYKMQKKER